MAMNSTFIRRGGSLACNGKQRENRTKHASNRRIVISALMMFDSFFGSEEKMTIGEVKLSGCVHLNFVVK